MNAAIAALLALLSVSAHAESFEALSAKADKAAKRGDVSAALDYYSSALRVWRSSNGTGAKAKLLKSRADLHERNADFDEALVDLSAALKLQPKSGPLLRRRGELFLRLNKPVPAIDDFYKAVSLNIEDREAYFGRGVAYELQGDMKFAEEDFRTACRMGMKKACGNAAEAKKRILRPLSETAAEFVEASENRKGPVEIKKPKAAKRRYTLDFPACIASLDSCLEEGGAFGDCVKRAKVCEKDPEGGCCPKPCIKEYEEKAADQFSEAEAYRQVFSPNARCASS